MEKGIEKFSGVIMPGLLLLVIGIAVYSLTLRHTDGETLRTGLQGLAVYVKPDFRGMTLGRFLQILLDAMSQLFFSLSVSMGIMITYGSYVKKDVDLNVSLTQIELFDTLAAFLAGMMIIPAVFVFSGTEGMGAGPSLMFVSLLNGSTAQILDLMDYISNSFLMPLIALLTSIFVGWVVGPDWIAEEMEVGGRRFRRKKLYAFMTRFVTPCVILILFLQSLGLLG